MAAVLWPPAVLLFPSPGWAQDSLLADGDAPLLIAGALALLGLGFGWWQLMRAQSVQRRLAAEKTERDAYEAIIDAGFGGVGVLTLVWPAGGEGPLRIFGTRHGMAVGAFEGSAADALAGLLDADMAGQVPELLEELHSSGKKFRIEGHDADGLPAVLQGARLPVPKPGYDLVTLAPVAVKPDLEATSGLTAADAFAILDVLPLPIWRRSAERAVIYRNAAFKRMDLEAVVGNQIQPLARAAMRSQAERSESRPVTLSGDRRLMEFHEIPLVDPAGESGITATAGYGLDMTALEEGQAQLARHQAAQEDLLNNLATAIAVYGRDRRLKFHNPAYQKLWGLEENWLDEQPPISLVMDRLRDARRLPEMADFPAYKRQMESYFTGLVEASQSLMHLPDGRTIRQTVWPHPQGGLAFTFEDVTDRLSLESSYNTQLQVQRASLNRLFEGICVFGSDGRLRLYNPVYADIWGLDPAYLDTLPHIREVSERVEHFFGKADHGENFAKRIVEQLANRHARTGIIERNDGAVFSYACVPLPDGAMLVTYLDVTDQRRVEAALRERNRALAAADRLKNEFLAGVSYELRNPLNVICGLSELLQGDYFGKLNDRQAEYVAGIRSASDTLVSLIDDILDVTGIEAGLVELDLDRFDLAGAVSGALQRLADHAEVERVSLDPTIDSDLPRIRGDERRLKQAVYNLLWNAIRVTPAGGTVAVELYREKEELVLLVQDGGRGVTPREDAEFVKARDGDGARPTPGSGGLTLALIRQLIGLHGGSIAIKHNPGVGMRVICHLPIAGPQEEAET